MIREARPLRLGALVAGLVGLVGCGVGWVLTPDAFYAAWLAAFVFWLGLPLGALGLALIHDLTGGAWGVEIRPALAAAIATLPGFVVAVGPVLIGLPALYAWAHAGATTGFLNPPFFILRAALYLVAWIALGWGVRALPARAAPALILLTVTASLAAVDWTMSLQHPWGSTSYAMVELMGQLVSGLCIAIVLTVALGQPTPEHLGDLGRLLLGGVLLWAYLAFTQYLIVWSEDLAAEIPFYLVLHHGVWRALAIVIALVHAVVPFLLLLRRDLKRSPAALGAVALSVLVGRLLYVWWLVVPATPGHAAFWLEPLAVLALGGPFLWFVLDRRRGAAATAWLGRPARERPA